MLGLAMAYVRLGQRHKGGAHPPHPSHAPAVDVPFRIRKTARRVPITSSTVTAVHGTKWMHELQAMCEAAGERLAAGAKELLRPDTPGATPNPSLHEGDLYLCKESLDAFEGALGGVCEAVDTIFDDSGSAANCKKAFVCIRPPGHHCSSDWPSGFCWINNVHVGIEHAIQNHGLTHAAIIDFDLHHGDGSQAIACERNARSLKAQRSTAKGAAFKRSSVGYFSIHDINSYPCEDGDLNKVQRASVCIEDAHGQNIWNVHLQAWQTADEFWRLYETQYLVLLDKARRYLLHTTQRLQTSTPSVNPKAAVFVSAGFDASEWETPSMQRHKVNVPTEFYARLTSDIVKLAREEGLGTDGRVISVLEGGYSDRAIASGVFSHITGLAKSSPSENEATKWNPEWWAESVMCELENIMKPHAPPQAAPVKKVSGPKEVPTYQTPTQSFTAKVVDPNKVQRHTSVNMPTPPKSRPATPPLPEVDWATAACQLSRLLVPSEDRQVDSCRHEELNEPRKRERHSSIGIQSLPTEQTGERMQTRGRKAQQDGLSGKEQQDRRQTLTQLPVHHEVRDGFSDSGISSSTVSNAKASRPTSRVQTKPRQTSSGSSVGLKVNKTRRTSLANNAPFDPPVTGTSLAPAFTTKQFDANPGDARRTDVDELTSGMKKISLKLPNPDRLPEASVQMKKGERKVPVPRGTRGETKKPTMPKSAKAKTLPQSVQLDSVAEPSRTEVSDTVGTIPIEGAPIPTSRQMAGQTVSPHVDVAADAANMHQPLLQHHDSVGGSSEYFSAPSLEPSLSPSISAAKGRFDFQDDTTRLQSEQLPPTRSKPLQSQIEFIPYQATESDGDGRASSSNLRQGPIHWLPPNTSTPQEQAAVGKENLPFFTATGHIPFRSDEAGFSNVPGAVHVPASNTSLNEGPAIKGEENTDPVPGLNNSVWDIPVTPRAPS